MLDHESFKRMLGQGDVEARRRAAQARDEFVFGIRDERAAWERGEWGGEYRVVLNHNVVLHVVPAYTEEMRRAEELPQFTIFMDDARAGDEETVSFEGVDDLEDFEGVRFFVGREEYHRIREELAAIREEYGDFAFIPDVLYRDTALIRLISDRVLENARVVGEREFDFTKLHFR